MSALDDIAARGVAAAKARVVERLSRVLGVRVEETSDGVRVEGRGLRARWLTEPALRWLGSWW